MDRKFPGSEKPKEESFKTHNTADNFLKLQNRRDRWKGEGEAFEKYLFGYMELRDPDSFQKEQNQILGEHASSGKFVPEYKVKQLIDLIKKYQKDSSVNPVSRYASDLRNKLKKNLGIADDGRLRFYTTVAKNFKTAVDIKLGIDAFFIFKDDDGIEHRINIDATTNPDIKGVGTADIIIGPEHVPDPQEEVLDYKEAIADIAHRIELKIKQIIERSRESRIKERYKRPQGSLITAGRKRKVVEYVPPRKNI